MTREVISVAVSNISNRHIEEAADFQIEKKMIRAHFNIHRAVAVAAAIMILFTMSISALAAADFESAYNLIYMVSPTIAQKLKPVKMSCEDNGIMFEVISAYVEGNEAKVYISVHDLIGDRIDGTTDLFDSVSINTSFDCSKSCENISYDAETKTATFLISISQWNEQDITGEKITFRVREMISNKQEYNSVLPEVNLDEIGEATDTFTPSHIRGGGGPAYDEYRENFQSLVSTGIICNPVDGVAISAVGYVDGKLHIQVRYDSIHETSNNGYVYLKNEDGDIIQCAANISYFVDAEQSGSCEEYIFDLTGKEISEYIPYGYFVTSGVNTKGNWSVTFPLGIEIISEDNISLVGKEAHGSSPTVYSKEEWNALEHELDEKDLAQSSMRLPENPICHSIADGNYSPPASIQEIITDDDKTPGIIVPNGAMGIFSKGDALGWACDYGDKLSWSFEKYPMENGAIQMLGIGYIQDGVMREMEVFSDTLSGKYEVSIPEKGVYHIYVICLSSDPISLKEGEITLN